MNYPVSGHSPTSASLISIEIRDIVADALISGDTVRLSEHVKRLATAYPKSGMSRRKIADALIIAASSAKVPIEMDAVD